MIFFQSNVWLGLDFMWSLIFVLIIARSPGDSMFYRGPLEPPSSLLAIDNLAEIIVTGCATYGALSSEFSNKFNTKLSSLN